MGLSRRSIFIVACGLAAASMACGDSASKADNSDASVNGGGNGDKTNGDGTNGNGTNGGQTNGGGTDGNGGNTSSAACTDGMPTQCTCGAMMGIAQCTGGVVGECVCGIDLSDAGLPEPMDCTGKFMCSMAQFITGIDGFCTPSTAAPVPDGGAGDGGASDGGASGGTTGGTTGFGPGGPGGFAIPPMCTTDADCDTAGIDVKCTTITTPLGAASLCIQPCTP